MTAQEPERHSVSLDIERGPELDGFVDGLLAGGLTSQVMLGEHVAALGEDTTVSWRPPGAPPDVSALLDIAELARGEITCPYPAEFTPRQEMSWLIRTLGSVGVLLEAYRPPHAVPRGE